MISEGSCDTEDWSNDAENVFQLYITGINYILQYIQIENQLFKLHNILQFAVYSIFNLINAPMVYLNTQDLVSQIEAVNSLLLVNSLINSMLVPFVNYFIYLGLFLNHPVDLKSMWTASRTSSDPSAAAVQGPVWIKQ